MNVLIARLSAMGDVVCTLPVASALKAQFPDCQITWVVDPRFADIPRLCTSIDHVVVAKPGWRPSTWPRLEGTFDFALDMQGLTKSGIVVGRAKASEKLGYHWQRELAPLFSRRVLPDPSSIHVVDQYVDVARACGVEVDRAVFDLVPDPEDRARCKAVLHEAGVRGPFVVMNAGAAWASKRWPSDHFAALVQSVQKRGVQCVFIGAPADEDRRVFQSVFDACASKPVDLVGKTTIKELVAMISLANAHVGGDTGSTHIAAALGVPAVGLYSITRPQRSCPYGQIGRCHYDPDSLSNIRVSAVSSTLAEVLA